VDGAKPYPYHSWTGVQGAQDATEAQDQVQAEEASLSPEQQAALQQQLNGRRLAQVSDSDLAVAAGSDQSGGASAQHLAAVHSTNQNYAKQKQALKQNFDAQQQALQQQLAAAPAGSPAKAKIAQQISSEQAAYTNQQAQLKAQTVSQNMNAQAWVGNVNWAAVPWVRAARRAAWLLRAQCAAGLLARATDTPPRAHGSLPRRASKRRRSSARPPPARLAPTARQPGRAGAAAAGCAGNTYGQGHMAAADLRLKTQKEANWAQAARPAAVQMTHPVCKQPPISQMRAFARQS
jgi:hypothetical protein